MKLRTMMLSAGVVLLLAAGAWGLLRMHAVILPKVPPEQKWCAKLTAADIVERRKAYGELGDVWRREWPSELHQVQNEGPSEPDEYIRAAMEALKSETDRAMLILGSYSLIYAPPHRVRISWIEDLVIGATMKSRDEWVKHHCALALCTLYALRGLAPPESGINMIRETLAVESNPDSIYGMLWSIHDMKSDLLPLKNSFEALREYPRDDVRKMADLILKMIGLPVTPEDRWRRAFPSGVT